MIVRKKKLNIFEIIFILGFLLLTVSSLLIYCLEAVDTNDIYEESSTEEYSELSDLSLDNDYSAITRNSVAKSDYEATEEQEEVVKHKKKKTKPEKKKHKKKKTAVPIILESSEDEYSNEDDDFVNLIGFKEWKNWADNYTDCDPRINSFLSPININTSTAIRGNTTQTLIVFSGSPTKNIYRLHSNVQLDNSNAKIHILNIQHDDTIYRDATYISGLGSKSLRLFVHALFMITTDKVDPELSVHQIDGKKFPMEIVFLFMEPHFREYTQIHVLVNINDEDNPLFYPIVQTIPQLKKKIFQNNNDGMMNIPMLDAQKLILESQVQDLQEIEKETTGREGSSPKRLKLLNRIVSQVEQVEMEMRKQPMELKELKDMRNVFVQRKLKYEYAKVKSKKKAQDAARAVDNKVDNHYIVRGDYNDPDVREMHEEMRNTASIIKMTDLMASKLRENLLATDTLNNKIELTMKTWNNLQAQGYNSSASLWKEIRTITANMNALEKLRNELEEVMDKIDIATMASPYHMIELPFQASWLFPAIGGHYAYNGSGPLPPCGSREFLIVMENSINISQEQFDMFKSIPLVTHEFEYGNQEMDSFFTDTTPPLQEVGDRKIWYNKKNLQYKSDDGVHLPSAQRKLLKERSKIKISNTPRVLPSIILQTMMLNLMYFSITHC